ncbi:uncharacterized protein LOC62_07G009518 [Vanrija pseudolonga]|uniref:Zn(2)-C6 fungal-type domain-containing protein n=1 Tax=Vanrija pseudolonga TaxID=143232 RepID=A0AAF0YIU6_9TREE|nr:hypothetical protein LOC62_07G009518 [Vanrija pseudolonga]
MATHAARAPLPPTHFASDAHAHSRSSTSPPAQPRKRRPHTRTSTGCRECRRQRIKCAEGPVSASSGRKVVCRRCWETDKQCHYPVGGRLQRGKGASEDMWEAAENVQQWPGSAALEAAREEWTRLAETWLQAQVTNSALVEGRMKVDITPRGFVGVQPKRRRAKHVDVGSILDPPRAPLPPTAPAVGFGASELVPPPMFSPDAGWVAFELPPLSESPGSDTSSSAHAVFPTDGSAVFPPNDEGTLDAVFVPLADETVQLVAPEAALAPVPVDPVAIVPLADASPPLGQATSLVLPDIATTTAGGDTAAAAAAADDDIIDLTSLPSESLQLAVRNSIIAESSPDLGPPDSDLSSLLEKLVNPTPASLLSTFSIAGLSDCPLSRSAVSYFETQGCIEIVATSKMSHNWIYTQLFPRALASLCSPKPLSSTGKPTVHTYIRDYLHSSLLHLSFVHRGNLESEDGKSWFWRCEAARSKQEADSAILKAKVLFTGPQWKTQEYLMAFFVSSMAQMLDGGTLEINPTTAFELPDNEADSEFATCLRDFIAVYSVVQFTCTPVDAMPHAPAPFTVPRDGPELVEQFFGFTRRIVRIMYRISVMVSRRYILIRAGSDASAPGVMLRSEATALLAEISDQWDWDEANFDPGRSDRTQRGNEVMRAACIVLLLTEVLETDLGDERITRERERAMELVGDAEPATMPGFLWALTIIGVYTRDKDARADLQHTSRLALSMSYGASYRGSDDIMALCWEVLDTCGAYEDGMAPWREAMHTFGRNMWL